MTLPLKREKESGEKYIRPPSVERAIQRAVTQGHAATLQQARTAAKNTRDYVSSECLVHLIRAAQQAGNGDEARDLLLVLLARCKANLDVTIRHDGVREPEKLREDILGEIALMFAEDAVSNGTELDYYECRFNGALRALRVGCYNYEVGIENKSKELPEDGNSGETDLASPSFWAPSDIENIVFAQEVLKFLYTLPKDERDAVVLTRLNHLTQEQAAKRLGVTDRTIRNLLERADKKLAKFKKEEA
jgi:RNA polymerase sigma factor (sigma-70 family)